VEDQVLWHILRFPPNHPAYTSIHQTIPIKSRSSSSRRMLIFLLKRRGRILITNGEHIKHASSSSSKRTHQPIPAYIRPYLSGGAGAAGGEKSAFSLHTHPSVPSKHQQQLEGRRGG
jgi:hypothetical protein